jgi:hypothetical protein
LAKKKKSSNLDLKRIWKNHHFSTKKLGNLWEIFTFLL